MNDVRDLELECLPGVLAGMTTVELATGKRRRIVQLNNAATTPPLAETVDAVSDFLSSYGALHRGQGPRARRTGEAVDQAVASIKEFLGAGPEHSILFTENSSAAINLFVRLFGFAPGDAVLLSEIEHTSNALPWKLVGQARVVEARCTIDGALDYDDFEAKARSTENLRVIAITGASNQSGYVPNLARLGRLAREVGALLFVDAAQLAPHRPINMTADGIDALVCSAHKLYAPFGLGVMVVPNALLDRDPVNVGGGSIDMITPEVLIWSPPAERHQLGTWNATGIVALGASCRALSRSWRALLTRERLLTECLLERLSRVPGLRLLVPPELYLLQDRLGVFPFMLQGYHYALLAAILEHEYGIEVRAGTICNHRLVRRWFDIDDASQAEIEQAIRGGNRLASYGVVRASLGFHNRLEDAEALGSALEEIATNGPRLNYAPVATEETFVPLHAMAH